MPPNMFEIRTQIFCFQRMGNLELGVETIVLRFKTKRPKIRTQVLKIQPLYPLACSRFELRSFIFKEWKILRFEVKCIQTP